MHGVKMPQIVSKLIVDIIIGLRIGFRLRILFLYQFIQEVGLCIHNAFHFLIGFDRVCHGVPHGNVHIRHRRADDLIHRAKLAPRSPGDCGHPIHAQIIVQNEQHFARHIGQVFPCAFGRSGGIPRHNISSARVQRPAECFDLLGQRFFIQRAEHKLHIIAKQRIVQLIHLRGCGSAVCASQRKQRFLF